jgi:hypothetical protein
VKYRVRMDMIFEAETDARALMASGAALTGRAVCIKAGTTDAEASFCELELCRHDEGGPCQLLERVEVTS